MAISASLLPFWLPKPQPTAQGEDKQGNNSSMVANTPSFKGLVTNVNMEGKKKVNRIDKFRFFRRTSVRISKSGSTASSPHAVKASFPPNQYATSSPDKKGLDDSPPDGRHTAPASHSQYSSAVSEVTSRDSTDIRTSCSSYPRDSLEQLKQDIAQTPPDSLGTAKSRPSRASIFFWKRMSLSEGPAIQEEEIVKAGLQEAGFSDDTIQTGVSSDGAPSSIMSSEMSEAMSSTHDTPETSVASSEENDNNDCGMAGIGIRNRDSISLHSLPVRYSVSPNLSPSIKPPYHPGMRYAPSNSSPLSSRSHSPSEVVAGSSTTMSNLNPANRSAKYRSGAPSVGRPQSLHQDARRLSSGRLNIVPNQSSIASEELMRILRGPSSYPEETLPRAVNDRNSLYLYV